MICMVSAEALSSHVVDEESLFASVHNASLGAAVLDSPKHHAVDPEGLSLDELVNAYVMVPA